MSRFKTFNVLAEIFDERRRQIHDDHHEAGEMARAAGVYAIGSAMSRKSRGEVFGSYWRWDRRRDLIKAAAMIVAEIERLDRETRKS